MLDRLIKNSGKFPIVNHHHHSHLELSSSPFIFDEESPENSEIEGMTTTKIQQRSDEEFDDDDDIITTTNEDVDLFQNISLDTDEYEQTSDNNYDGINNSNSNIAKSSTHHYQKINHNQSGHSQQHLTSCLQSPSMKRFLSPAIITNINYNNDNNRQQLLKNTLKIHGEKHHSMMKSTIKTTTKRKINNSNQIATKTINPKIIQQNISSFNFSLGSTLKDSHSYLRSSSSSSSSSRSPSLIDDKKPIMPSLIRQFKSPKTSITKQKCINIVNSNDESVGSHILTRRSINSNNNNNNSNNNMDSIRIDIEDHFNHPHNHHPLKALDGHRNNGSNWLNNNVQYPIFDLFDSSSSNPDTPILHIPSLNQKHFPVYKRGHQQNHAIDNTGSFRFNTNSNIANDDYHHLLPFPSQSSSIPPKKSPISTRISILGKPLPIRKEVSFYRERILIYNLLQRPKGFWAVCYHQFVVLIVVLGLILFALSTVDQYYQDAIKILRIFDAFILAVLVVEFLARAWSSSCISKYQGWFGFFRFLTSAFRLIDIFVILSSAAVLWVHHADPSSSHRMNIDWLRFAQAFQVLRISHRFRPWRIMASVIWTQRDHLAIAIYMCTLSLIFITFTVYFIEHTQPNTDFTSIPKTLWWGIVSLLTIGYGDMVPATTAGKIMASILLLICFSAFALPAGILGTGLALKVQEQQRQKHFNKRRDPAARLIQCAWRCYASSKNSRSIATWKACVKRNKNSISITCSNDKLSDQQVETGTFGSMVDLKLIRNKIHRFVSESQASLVEYGRSNIMEPSSTTSKNKQHRVLQRTTLPIIDKNNSSNYICEYFTSQEKNMIRFIRVLKFEVAKKNFKNAFRPYDINDVIEQYAAGHADVVSRVKIMHARVNSIQNAIGNVIKMCQDLNYIHHHQMDRLERTIREFSQRLAMLPNNNQQSTGSFLNVSDSPNHSLCSSPPSSFSSSSSNSAQSSTCSSSLCLPTSIMVAQTKDQQTRKTETEERKNLQNHHQALISSRLSSSNQNYDQQTYSSLLPKSSRGRLPTISATIINRRYSE